MSSQHNGVPFTFLSSLFREISRIKPRSSNNTQPKTKQDEYPALQIFKRWLNALHQKFDPLSEGTTAAIFRLVFPEEDAKRKYDMQEGRLIEVLATCHGLESRTFTQWDSYEGSGCLGQEVRAALEHINSNEDSYIGPLTITRVDELLSELAALSPFSDASIREQFPKHTRRSRIDVIRNMYRAMSPEDASYLTQIILKDLRPLLYPLSEDYSVSPLTSFNTRAVTMLTKMDAMRAWDPSGAMLQASRIFSDMDRAAAIFEMPAHQRPEMKPTVGVMVDIPKSKKGQSCNHSLNFLRSARRVWAETKYDGERAQIHVTVPAGGGKPHITIFSKSKRDSTLDRHDVHNVIREALGFSGNSGTGRIKQSVILDAELVAFDGERVDEFWRIRRLVETTAYGVRAHRASRYKEQSENEEGISQASMMSDDSDTRRLGLVFFDILSLESRSLIFTPYNDRRSILETIIQPKASRAILAKRFPIDMTVEEPERALCEIFAEHIADCEEGLVLKAEGSYYNDHKLPWVKFKKDYIPGYGDTIDMVLVGAGWEKQRARELRVGTNIFTTFYFGAFKGNPKIAGKGQVPHIEVIFTASYGLNRKQLEDLNFLIRSSDSVQYPLNKGQPLENYTFNLYAGLEPPSVLLQEPLLVELFGAGFTKPPQCLYYELRWPRMAKVFRARERSWKEGLDLRTLHDIACAAVGRDRSDKEIDDSVKAMFGIPVSPGAKCASKRRAVVEEWEEKLRALDGESKKAGKRAVPSSSASPPKRRRLMESSVLRKGEHKSHPHRGVTAESRNVSGGLHQSSFSSSQRRKIFVDQGDGKKTDEKPPLTIVTNVIPPPSESQVSGYEQPASQHGFSENTPIATPAQSQALHDDLQLLTPPPSSPSWSYRSNSSSSSKAPGTAVASRLDDVHVWVMRNGGSLSATTCPSCSELKKQISKEKRVHSIDSLLMACGWSEGVEASAWVHRGMIVVENHGPHASKQLDELLKYLRTRISVLRQRQRKPISVMTCDGIGTLIFVFNLDMFSVLSSRSLSTARLSSVYRPLRAFSSSRICLGRAIVYSDNGDPKTVLEALTLPKLAVPPPPSSVNIKFLLSPINPADINVIEGVYPSKPTKTDALTAQGKGSEGQPVFVGGNEGLAQVVAVGEGVKPEYLKEGDWVVVTKQQSGTWMTERNIPVVDVARVPNAERLTEAQAATLTVNPPTAYNMLHDFVQLKEGDWVTQNGANSAVGQAVIQIAAAKGLKTINLVRNRPNLEELKSSLEKLGATHVLTYDDLADKSVRDKIKGWTGGKDIRLGLNCVGGKETTLMARYLGKDAHLVSYGAMSKQPLSLPTSLFIFKNLTSHGFWQSQWYKTRSSEDRDALMKTLVEYIIDKKLDTPEIEVVQIGKDESDGSATEKIRGVMEALSEGRYGKKVLLKLD